MPDYENKMGRRYFLKASGGVAALASTAGCSSPASADSDGLKMEELGSRATRNLETSYIGKTLEELEEQLPDTYEVSGVVYELSGIEEANILPYELDYRPTNADVDPIEF
ncbi:MAG: twin-arginine translocation signal domain-containing protein, partial [Candidatus Nanohaloarchaea archaeon]